MNWVGEKRFGLVDTVGRTLELEERGKFKASLSDRALCQDEIG